VGTVSRPTIRSRPTIPRWPDSRTTWYRWVPLTAQDLVDAESMAVQVLPPAIAVAVLASLRVYGKDQAQFADRRSELARLVRDIRWLAKGDLPR
jgi:hypothetical protein